MASVCARQIFCLIVITLNSQVIVSWCRFSDGVGLVFSNPT